MKRPEITYDALRNTQNWNQQPEKYKRVLCVCSGGLLRSPTTAFVLASEFNCNTRSAGIDFHHALTCVDDVLMEWADEIVVMDEYMESQLQSYWPNHGKRVLVLNIPDQFRYRDPRLVAMIKDKYPKAVKAADEALKARLASVGRAKNDPEPKGEVIPERQQQGPAITVEQAEQILKTDPVAQAAQAVIEKE